MDDKKAIKTKLGIIAVLACIIVGVFVAYSSSYSRKDKVEDIRRRWAELETIGIPDACFAIDGILEGGIHGYGIDARQILILDITGMGSGDVVSVNEVTENIKTFYTQALKEWHPGYLEIGSSKAGEKVNAAASTVHGPAGLAIVEVDSFWYNEVAQKRLGEGIANIITSRVKPADGIGHRYALVNIIICTRP